MANGWPGERYETAEVERARPLVVARYVPWKLPLEATVQVYGVAERCWRDVLDRADGGEPVHDVPGELGCYDAASGEALTASATLARRYGIDGFLWPHYWPETPGRPSPIDRLLRSAAAALPVAAWWVVGAGGVAGDELRGYDAEAHADHLLTLFGDERYLRWNGAPIIFVDRPDLVQSVRSVFDRWQGRVRGAGFGEIAIICPSEALIDLAPEAAKLTQDELKSPEQRLAVTGPCPFRAGLVVVREPTVLRYGPLLRGAEGVGSSRTPSEYRRSATAQSAAAGPGGLLVVESWNDWLLGTQLEPGRTSGLDWLDAHAAGVVPTSHPDEDLARSSLLTNRYVMRVLEREAVGGLATGQLDEALAVARAAADWACHQTAVWVSPELEALAAAAGSRLLEGLAAWQPSSRSRRRVAHVLTEARSIGGHTRLSWRWMQEDRGSDHSVVLTGQGDLPVPPELVAATGGRVVTIATGTPTEQVRELAEVLTSFDLVVLHVHPYDIVAVVACAVPSKRPPVVLLNHADHLFWLGVVAADAVANIRPSARVISAERRGLDVDRNVQLPLPLGAPERRIDRETALSALGLPPSALVMSTMASSYKYTRGVGPTLHELIASVLDQLPDACVVAVGPEAGAPGWSGLLERYPGQVVALGTVNDTLTVRSAADVYLDSYPFASITSLLEAAALGTPAVCFQPRIGLAPMYFDDLGVEPCVASTPESFVDTVVLLLRDAERRATLGASLAAAVAAVHTGDGWRDALEVLYAAVRHGAAQPPLPRDEIVGQLDDALFVLHERSGIVRDARTLLRHHGLAPSGGPGGSPVASTAAERIGAELGRVLIGDARPGQRTASVVRSPLGPWLGELRASLADAVVRLVAPRDALEIGPVAPLIDAELAERGVGVASPLVGWRDLVAAEVGGAVSSRRQVWDFIVCAGLLSRLGRFEEQTALDALCGSARALLLVEVARPEQETYWRPDPLESWAPRFADRGLFRAGALLPAPEGFQTLLLRRTEASLSAVVSDYEEVLARTVQRYEGTVYKLSRERDAARHQQHLTWLELEGMAGRTPTNLAPEEPESGAERSKRNAGPWAPE